MLFMACVFQTNIQEISKCSIEILLGVANKNTHGLINGGVNSDAMDNTS